MNVNIISNWYLLEGKDITNLKLQKLLYYSQGMTLAITDNALFNEEIYAWKYGPVVRPVYDLYKKFGKEEIISPIVNITDIEEPYCSILRNINTIYGDLNAIPLSSKTHDSRPYLEGKERDDKLITKESMKIFFREEKDIREPDDIISMYFLRKYSKAWEALAR